MVPVACEALGTA